MLGGIASAGGSFRRGAGKTKSNQEVWRGTTVPGDGLLVAPGL